MFVETVETISTGLGVLDIGTRLFPTVNRIASRIRNGELTIAIFGSGGTGKTTLARLLAADPSTFPSSLTYQESFKIEKFSYQLNGLVSQVLVAPGQERRQDSWGDLLRLISQGKVKLIIHVGSWGYHSFSDLSYTETKYYQPGMSIEEFMPVFLDARREQELLSLDTLIPHIGVSDLKQISLLTLVTKQDLWWKHRNQAKLHYQSGQYLDRIEQILRTRGQNFFRHEYASACLTSSNLITSQNEMLAQTAEGYDDYFRRANLEYLLAVIENLIRL